MSDTSRSSSITVVDDPEAKSPLYDAPIVKKYIVVFTTSFITLTACFGSTALFSAANEIAREFDTTPSIVNASSAGILFTMGISNFFWGPFIPLIGRMYTYNSCIVALLVWTIAASLAPNLTTFTVFRVMSGLQGTFFHVTSQAIIAEYFPPVNRGTATGFFLCGTVLGPPIGPLIAGIIITFTTWRVILYVQAGMVAVGLAMSLIFLREVGKPATLKVSSILDVARAFSPLKVLRLMFYPNLALTNLACGLLSFSQYALLASPTYILNTQYGITSPLISGLFYLSPAGGFLVGTLLGGHFSDRTVRAWIQHRAGVRVPQDRLRSGYACWFLIIPAATLIYGWSIDRQFGGLALPIVAAFFVAAGILAAFAGLNTYCAEVLPDRRRDAIATKYVLQYSFSAIASGVTIPMIDAVGVGAQCTICVALIYIAGGLCIVTVTYGRDMHAWVERRWPKQEGKVPEQSAVDCTACVPCPKSEA